MPADTNDATILAHSMARVSRGARRRRHLVVVVVDTVRFSQETYKNKEFMMQLFGPSMVAQLPNLPPGAMGMQTPWFMDIWQLPVLGNAGDRWGLAELTEPTEAEWIELAFRLGIPFSEFDYALARLVDSTEEFVDLPSGDRVSRVPTWRVFVQQCRQRCLDKLPPNQAYAVDGLGTLGRVHCIQWEE